MQIYANEVPVEIAISWFWENFTFSFFKIVYQAWRQLRPSLSYILLMFTTRVRLFRGIPHHRYQDTGFLTGHIPDFKLNFNAFNFMMNLKPKILPSPWNRDIPSSSSVQSNIHIYKLSLTPSSEHPNRVVFIVQELAFKPQVSPDKPNNVSKAMLTNDPKTSIVMPPGAVFMIWVKTNNQRETNLTQQTAR